MAGAVRGWGRSGLTLKVKVVVSIDIVLLNMCMLMVISLLLPAWSAIQSHTL